MCTENHVDSTVLTTESAYTIIEVKKMNFDLMKELLLTASMISAICLAFIQKIKKHIKCSRCIPYYSFAINMIIAIIFCLSFTNISFPLSMWTGFFSYIGADTLYKTLEGKLASHTTLTKKTDDTNNLEEIPYE